MGSATIKEATEILKRLSPKNQEYFMTLVRVAGIAENSIKDVTQQPGSPPADRIT